MDGNQRRRARGASFSSGTEVNETAPVNPENGYDAGQTARRRRMDRYPDGYDAGQTRPQTAGHVPAENVRPQQTAAPAPVRQIPAEAAQSGRGPAPVRQTVQTVPRRQPGYAERQQVPDTGRYTDAAGIRAYPSEPGVTWQNPGRIVRGAPETTGQQPVRTPEYRQVNGQGTEQPSVRYMPAENSQQPAAGGMVTHENSRVRYTGGNIPVQNGPRPVQYAANGKPIREWQKNAPNPPMTIHRDLLTDDGEDPLLASTRSPDVYNRTGKFWVGDAVNERPPKQNNGRAAETTEDNDEPEEKETVRWKPILHAMMFIAAILGIWLILRFTLFRISTVTVTGTENYRQEAEQLSRVIIGDNILTLDTERIKSSIESNVHLIMADAEKNFPGEVIVTVREREPAVFLNYCGITYVTDKNGTVLTESEDTGYRPAGLIEVKGLKIRTSFTVGQKLPLVTETQAGVFRNLFLEIRVAGCGVLIREADLSNPDEVYLLTTDDISVALGNSENFHAKLRSMTIVREEIISRGYSGGTIDVKDPEHPTYVPPSV